MAKIGRPRKITEQTLQKLEEAFLKGLSDREACLYADIAPSTLYLYCEKHPKFSERKELLKEQPKMRAKMNLVAAIEQGSIEISQYYLERKAPEEFNLRHQLQLNGELNNNVNFSDAIQIFLPDNKRSKAGVNADDSSKDTDTGTEEDN